MIEVERWISDLGSSDEKIRKNAYGNLLKCGKIAIKQIFNGFKNNNPRIRHGCLFLIYKINDSDILPILKSALLDSDEKVKELANDLTSKSLKELSDEQLLSIPFDSNKLFNDILIKFQMKILKSNNKEKNYQNKNNNTKSGMQQQPKTSHFPKTKKFISKSSQSNTQQKLAKDYHIFTDKSSPSYKPRSREGYVYQDQSIGGMNMRCRFCLEWFPKREIGSHQVDCLMNPRN